MSHLPALSLPLPDGCLPLPLTLALVEVMETEAGSLYALAATVLAGEAAHGTLIKLLRAIYRHGGCDMKDEALESYLLTLNAVKIVTEILAAVLTPLSRIDIAVEHEEGERAPVQAGG